MLRLAKIQRTRPTNSDQNAGKNELGKLQVRQGRFDSVVFERQQIFPQIRGSRVLKRISLNTLEIPYR